MMANGSSEKEAAFGRGMAGGIAPAVVRLNAAVPFLGIELFDRALRHRVILQCNPAIHTTWTGMLFKLGVPKCDGVA